MIDIGQVITIYSCQTVNEPFFLCKVLEKCHANENVADDNDHYIPAGNDYMICNYFGRMSENLRKGSIQYTLIEKQKIYITYNQILGPHVLMSPDL